MQCRHRFCVWRFDDGYGGDCDDGRDDDSMNTSMREWRNRCSKMRQTGDTRRSWKQSRRRPSGWVSSITPTTTTTTMLLRNLLLTRRKSSAPSATFWFVRFLDADVFNISWCHRSMSLIFNILIFTLNNFNFFQISKLLFTAGLLLICCFRVKKWIQ